MAKREVIGIHEKPYGEYLVELRITRYDTEDLDKDGLPAEIEVFKDSRPHVPAEMNMRPVEATLSYLLAEADIAVIEDDCNFTNDGHDYDEGFCINCGAEQDAADEDLYKD